MIIKVEGKTGDPFITEAKENLPSGKRDKEDHWLEKKTSFVSRDVYHPDNLSGALGGRMGVGTDERCEEWLVMLS